MIFDSRDLEYDISKDYDTKGNVNSYNARSGLGLGLSFTFEHNQHNHVGPFFRLGDFSTNKLTDKYNKYTK